MTFNSDLTDVDADIIAAITAIQSAATTDAERLKIAPIIRSLYHVRLGIQSIVNPNWNKDDTGISLPGH